MELGDIYTICAAPELPLFKQIKDDLSLKSKTTQMFASSEYSRMCQNSSSNPPLPCIICSLPSKLGDDRLAVCMMRDFPHSDIPQLPLMTQHYIVPIHVDQMGYPEHIHTNPDWPTTSNQWVVIAIPMEPPDGSLRDRFQSHENSQYSVDKSAVRALLRLCATKKQVWGLKPRVEKRAAADQLRVNAVVLSRPDTIR